MAVVALRVLHLRRVKDVRRAVGRADTPARAVGVRVSALGRRHDDAAVDKQVDVRLHLLAIRRAVPLERQVPDEAFPFSRR